VLPERTFDVPGFVGNPVLAEMTIGWRAKISLSEGMERLRDDLARYGRPIDEVTMPPQAMPKSARPIKDVEFQGEAG
jgi:hypothetical protein